MNNLNDLWERISASIAHLLALVHDELANSKEASERERKRLFIQNFVAANYHTGGTLVFQALNAIDGVADLHRPRTQQDVEVYSSLPVRIFDGKPFLQYRGWKTSAFREHDAKLLEHLLQVELDNLCGRYGFSPVVVKVQISPTHGRLVTIWLGFRNQ